VSSTIRPIGDSNGYGYGDGYGYGYGTISTAARRKT